MSALPYAYETCATCAHHHDSSDGSGQCRALPPTEPDFLPTPVPPLHTTVAVKVRTYIRTADDCPACALYRPLVEPEAPPVESRAEKIARLCKGGNVDLVELKRAIEGR
jgi:phenylpropionate dioxygenase-like ring-hydroxylating dioxygenase large terminal subunit